MKSFLIAWLVAFGLVAVIAGGIGWFVGSNPPPSASPSMAAATARLDNDSGPFSEAEAIEVVSRRLPFTERGEQLRRALKTSATVTPHSYRHWRVCYDGACWVAHGPGRYAEPENDAARNREAPGARSR